MLHAAIPRRRTSRAPFLDQPVAPEAERRLEAAADHEGAALQVYRPYDTHVFAQVVHEADREQRWDPAVRDEVRRWIRTDEHAVDGVPTAAFGPVAYDSSSLVRDFALGTPMEGRARADFEPSPSLAVLLTHADTALDWLRGGMALERVWLEAVVQGLSVSLLMQPLEISRLRWLARPSSTGGASRPQAVLRLGTTTQESPPTPRRPLDHVLHWSAEGPH